MATQNWDDPDNEREVNMGDFGASASQNGLGAPEGAEPCQAALSAISGVGERKKTLDIILQLATRS